MPGVEALKQYLTGSESETEITPPGTGGGRQDGRPAEILAGGPPSNSSPILPSSNLQLEKKSEKNLDTKKFSKISSRLEYRPEFAEQMYSWFANLEKFRIITETAYWKNGEERTKQIQIANPPPHFSEFARSIGTTERTLKRWAREHDEFAESYEACQAIIKEFLINNGLLKGYDPTFAKFAATNLTNMKDKTEHLNKNVDLNKILDKAAKSNSPFDVVDDI